MTIISNDPIWWPVLDYSLFYSYCVVASSIVVAYDWALISGQEFELVWVQRWSLITFIYLSVRCLGVLFCGSMIIWSLLSVSVTDAGCTVLFYLQSWIPVVVMAMLGVVMIIRLHAMYQGSRKMLILLVVILLLLTIAAGGILSIDLSYTRAEQDILSGMHKCQLSYLDGHIPLLIGNDWAFVIGLTWEVLALCLAVWVAIKHFRELQRQARGWTVRGCFTVLIKTHVHYFAAFALTSFFTFGELSPNLPDISVGIEIYEGFIPIVTVVQLFVLGPRLILSVRAHHAQLLATSDEGTTITTIVFQERLRESMSSDV